jgi:hypothetical protein
LIQFTIYYTIYRQLSIWSAICAVDYRAIFCINYKLLIGFASFANIHKNALFKNKTVPVEKVVSQFAIIKLIQAGCAE